MKTISIAVPERLEKEIQTYIQGGWFKDESDLLQTALRDFLRKNKASLSEKFIREDIDWALELKKR